MEAQISLGETPLRHAVLGNHLEVVELLHERGAAFIPQDRISCTTLSDAGQFNAHAVLPFLLGLRMRVDLIYFSGKTVLHILAENSDVYTMQIFLDLAETGVGKIDVDHVDHKGYTTMEYIHLRSDADEVLEAFKRIISRIQIEKQGTAMLCSKDQDADDDGDFADAVEVQESCA
ncbi:hypothetical protein ACEPPN_015008 [Leptodophora sp. 'Broadleaf-Isolate-01']